MRIALLDLQVLHTHIIECPQSFVGQIDSRQDEEYTKKNGKHGSNQVCPI
jgi:hypothetical protein